MPYDLSNKLVVGVSSTALFDLREEDRIYKNEGLPAFRRVQEERQDVLLKPGTAFYLIKKLLGLNSAGLRRVEVLLISKNHPDVHLRVYKSIRQHGLGIERIFLNGGEPLGPYLTAYPIHLFLSSSAEDVATAIEQGIPAGQILNPPHVEPAANSQVRIAFDGDCVLFDQEADLIGRENLALFLETEDRMQLVPLGEGPFAKLIRTISAMQGDSPESSPFRIGLVTARNAPAHIRPILTLQSWGVRVDSAAFLGGLPKEPWLRAFQPHIFFDDQIGNCDLASGSVPTAVVHYPPKDARATVVQEDPVIAASRDQFLLVCRSFLRTKKGEPIPVLEQWFDTNLKPKGGRLAERVVGELAESVEGTPASELRKPAIGADQTQEGRLLSFLARLLEKHESGSQPQ